MEVKGGMRTVRGGERDGGEGRGGMTEGDEGLD